MLTGDLNFKPPTVVVIEEKMRKRPPGLNLNAAKNAT
jgi:hypothetical protein